MLKKLMVICFILSVSSIFANDEFKIKRENIFTFKTEPKVVDENGAAKISFETNGYCDVTIVIEDDAGKIIRHLLSGVLGDNAPAPFQKKSKSQSIIWDYKDDAGVYPTSFEKLNVRVSLGLKPQFEKSLFWSPEKRINREGVTLVAPCSKGVLTFEGEGRDQLKLYSHAGEYIKTIYPFSNKDLNKIKTLNFVEFPQDGKSLPIKVGNKHFSTLLKIGPNYSSFPEGRSSSNTGNKYLSAASAMVVYGDKIGLLGTKLAILTLGDDLENVVVEGPMLGGARSAALSPDGKWIYYTYGNVVKRIAFQKDGVAEVFAGNADGKLGKSDKEFDGIGAIACDSKGRVYVTDYCNDRVQVFSDKGELLKSIKFTSPNKIDVDPKSGDIYVSSWLTVLSPNTRTPGPAIPELFHLGNFDNPVLKNKFPLPFVGYITNVFMNEGVGDTFNITIDFFETDPIFWVLPGRIGTNSEKWMGRGLQINSSEASSMKLMKEDGKALKTVADFGPRITASAVRFLPPVIARQRLYVNPANEKLYIAEGDSGVMKSFKQLVEIDPETGKVNLINIPITAEDLCFDYTGLIYFRTGFEVVRYNPTTWKEIPFDYGVEAEKVGFEGHGPNMISAIKLPTIGLPGQFHLGGMAINHKLNLIVSCYNSKIMLGPEQFVEGIDIKRSRNGQYMPTNYPGRVSYAEIHMWDRQGKLLKEDIFPGLGVTDGLAIDNDDDIYVLVDGARVNNGKPFFDPTSETLIKAKPNQARVLSNSKRAEIPLPNDSKPKRDLDFVSGSVDGAWVEGVEWMYGGVGFAGFSVGYAPSCACWNARFATDVLKRSFVPEVSHYSIAVLDGSGNLIMRIGQYGNVDDGKPLVKEGSPKNAVSIGGDEVALFHAAYVATLTDKRLFIADAGNSRILSVKLGYYEQKINSIKMPNFKKEK